VSDVRGPTSEQRSILLGRTGSGKSQFGVHLLSQQNFDEKPHVIIDYKGEKLIRLLREQNKCIKTISVYDNPPTKPGLYWMCPTPKVDDEAIEAWLWKVYNRARKIGDVTGGMGLFIDEGFALPQKDAFDVILTQGRSLHISVICLYQRPAWMSRFAVAQADFFAVFDQNDERDLKTTKAFIKPAVTPNGEIISVYTELPPYYSLWYDVGKGKTSVLKPAPEVEAILSNFKRRLNPRHAKGKFI
jgi:hypothetical protein